MRLLSNSDYQVTLTDWINRLTNGEVVSNPITDWAGETGRSRSLRSLRDFLQSENGDMPPFFNHYPTKESDNYRGLFNDTTIEEIREADANVRASISFHSRDIIVMFGARPTLLYPNPQRRNYLASVCPYVDLYWLQKDICGFVVWWPDTGLLNHTHMACQALLKQIWQLAAHKLHVLVCKLDEVAANAVGVEPKEAYNILDWLKDHPTSLQLDELLKELTIMWTKKESVATARSGTVTPFQAMDENYQALELYRLGKKERDNLMAFWMKNYIDSGLFIPFPHESNEEQWVRWWRQINMEKMLRGNDSRSIWLTCCWCGQLTKKVLQQGKVNFGTVKDGCPNKMSHSVGWSVVQGKYDDIFPDSNLFLLFFESLPSSIVINHWQLSVEFIDFLSENQWHVQAKFLHDKYKEIFPSIRRFASDTATKGLSTSLILGLTNAMEKLGKLNPPKDVKIFKRNTRKEKKRGKKNTGKTKTLFAIRVAVENTEKLIDLEDFSYKGYGKTFGISPRPIWPDNYPVDQSAIASTSRHNVSNE